MTQQTQPQGFQRAFAAPTRNRRYQNEQVPLSAYVLQGLGGMGFMMFVFWLAGFGS